jgi:hypothetical protein
LSRFLRSVIATILLLLPLVTIASGDDTKTSTIPPELAAADQLYRAGKFAEAEVGYRGVLKNDSKLAPAEVLLAQVGPGAGYVAPAENR